MWIKRLVLENFANIKTGMDTYKLELDFSERKSPICIFVGPNGCGKTSILSLLNPFATIGNLDVRDGQDLIIEGKPGYKEIEIINNDCTYLIKHYYSVNKTSHSVKSYIQKNGVELNGNGNVTSFKELVKEELDIEMDYLKLIRLGKNVSSLLDASSTERKAFMGKIMDIVDVYLKYHKKITSDVRELKVLMSHTIDKINSLRIDKLEDAEKEEKKLNTIIQETNERLDELKHEKIILTEFLNSYGGLKEYQSQFKEISRKYNKMKSVLEKHKTDYKGLEQYQERIVELESEIKSTETDITKTSAVINTNIDFLNTVMSEKEDLDISMEKYNNRDDELSSLRSQINDLRVECNLRKEFWKDVNLPYTKEEVEKLMLYLRDTQDKLFKIYEYGKPVLEKSVELLSSNKDIIAYTNNGILECMKNDDVVTYLKKILGDAMVSANSSGIKSECEKSKCSGCIGYYLCQTISEMTKSKKVSSDHDIEFYQYVLNASQTIKSVFESTKEYRDIIEKLPEKIKKVFLSNNLYKKISKGEQIYSLEDLSDLHSYVTEYESHKEKLKLLSELEIEEKEIINDPDFNALYNRRKDLEEIIDTYKKEIKDRKEKVKNLEEVLESLKTELEETRDIVTSILEFNDVEKEYLESSETEHKLASSTDRLSNVISYINDSLKSLNDYQKQKENLKYRIIQYKSLEKELKKYRSVYDDLDVMRRALSSKEGIPLIFIKMYLANTKEIANELLGIVFDGNIEIDDFEISADDFLIPYIKNGKKIKDVKCASQGEMSFFQLAISFALCYQSISKYNIILLDEIDGGLDPENREKFIEILEHQIEMINAEQIFLITHNEMFNVNEVDVLDLTPGLTKKESRTNNVIIKRE